MSIATTDIVETPAVSRLDIRAAAIAAANEAVPLDSVDEPGPTLSAEDVAGAKPAEADAKPDRELVAPSIREFLRAQTPTPEKAPSALEKEIATLREAMDGLAGKSTEPGLSTEERTLAKLEALEARDLARTQADDDAAAEAEYNQTVATMRAGVIENITAQAKDFPGLIALEQQETVFNALVSRSQEGLETSEDEIASEVEDGLRTVYEKLHAVYGSATPSEAKSADSEPKVTLNPALSSTTEAADTEKMSRSERIEYLWAKSQQTP
jgi:hypothetical protein